MEDLNVTRNEALNLFSKYEKNREKYLSILTTRVVVEQDDWKTEDGFAKVGSKKPTIATIQASDRMSRLVSRMRDSIVSEVSTDIEIAHEKEEITGMKIANKEFGNKHRQSFESISKLDFKPITIQKDSFPNSLLMTGRTSTELKTDQQIQEKYIDLNENEKIRKVANIQLSSDGTLTFGDDECRSTAILSHYALASKERDAVHQKSRLAFRATNSSYFTLQDAILDVIEKCWLKEEIQEESLPIQRENIHIIIEEYDFYRERLESLWDDIGRLERLESIDQHKVEAVFGKREDLIKDIEKKRELDVINIKQEKEVAGSVEQIFSSRLSEEELKRNQDNRTDNSAPPSSISRNLSVEERISSSRLQSHNKTLSRGNIETGWNHSSIQLKDQAAKVQKRQLYMIRIAKEVRKRWKDFVLRKRFQYLKEQVERGIMEEAFLHWFHSARTGAIDRYSTLRWVWNAWISNVNRNFYASQQMTLKLNRVYYSRLTRMCFIFWKRWTIYKKIRQLKGCESIPPIYSEAIPWWNRYIEEIFRKQINHKKAEELYRKTLLRTSFLHLQSIAMDNHLLKVRENNFIRVSRVKILQKYFSQWHNFIQHEKDNYDNYLNQKRKIFKGWKNLVEIRKKLSSFPEIKQRILLREGFLRWRKRYLQMRLLENAATVRIITKRPLALFAYAALADDHVQYSCISTFRNWKAYLQGRKLFYWFIGKEWQRRRHDILQYYFYVLKYKTAPQSRSSLDVVQEYGLMNDFLRFKREFQRSQDRGDIGSQVTVDATFNLRMKFLFHDFMNHADPNSKMMIFQKTILLAAARRRELHTYRTNIIISGEVEEMDSSSIKASIQRKFALARKVVGLFIKKQLAQGKKDVDELTCLLDFMRTHIARNRKLMIRKIQRDRELALRFLAKEAAIQLASVSKTFKAVVQDTKLSSVAQAQLVKLQKKKREMEEKLDRKRNEKMERSMHFVRTVVQKLKEKSKSNSSIIWDDILEAKLEAQSTEDDTIERPTFVRTASGRLTEVKDLQSFIQTKEVSDFDDIEDSIFDPIDDVSEEETNDNDRQELIPQSNQETSIITPSAHLQSNIPEEGILTKEIGEFQEPHQKKVSTLSLATQNLERSNNTSRDSDHSKSAKGRSNLDHIPKLVRPFSALGVSSRKRKSKSSKETNTKSCKDSDTTKLASKVSFEGLFSNKPRSKGLKTSVVVPGKIQELNPNLNDTLTSHDTFLSESDNLLDQSDLYSSVETDDEIARLSKWVWDHSYIQESKIIDAKKIIAPSKNEAQQVLKAIQHGRNIPKATSHPLHENDFLSSIISLGKEIESNSIGKQDFIIQEDINGYVVHFPKEVQRNSPLSHDSQLPFHERLLLRAQLAQQKREQKLHAQKLLQQRKLEEITIMQKEAEKWKTTATSIVNNFQQGKHNLQNVNPTVKRRFQLTSRMSNSESVTALELILRLNLKQEQIYSEEITNEIMELRKKVYPIIMALKDTEVNSARNKRFEKNLQVELDQMKLRMSEMERFLDIQLKETDEASISGITTNDQIPIAATLPYVLDVKHQSPLDLKLSHQNNELLHLLIDDSSNFVQQWPMQKTGPPGEHTKELWDELFKKLKQKLNNTSSKVREEGRKLAIKKRRQLNEYMQKLSNTIQRLQLELIQTQSQMETSALYDNVYFQDKFQHIQESMYMAEATLHFMHRMLKDVQKLLSSKANQIPSVSRTKQSAANKQLRSDTTLHDVEQSQEISNHRTDNYTAGSSHDKHSHEDSIHQPEINIGFSVEVRPTFSGRRHSSIAQTSYRDLGRAKYIEHISTRLNLDENVSSNSGKHSQ